MAINSYSILIGGKAGFGIDKASLIIAGVLNRIGYRIYVYRDYPSIIRGGHTFSVIRASRDKVATHLENIDFLLVLDQDTFNIHKINLTDTSTVIYDSDVVKINTLPKKIRTIGIPLTKIIKEENANEVMRNSGMIGALFKAAGVPWPVVESCIKKEIPNDSGQNLKIALRCYRLADEKIKIIPIDRKALPLLTGNEALGLGLLKAGLNAYIAYPMTPSSPILHFLARHADKFSLKVLHPESEIAVILMALGFSYCGDKVAVGTSGGGFCLMTEGLSFAGMAELPVVIIVGGRPGPSTGLPTYSAQTELDFVISAGQGEFPRVVIAPGDAEEAYYSAQVALNIATKYQIPAIILSDKNMGEGTYSFDIDSIEGVEESVCALWNGSLPYKRYLGTRTGVSPAAFPSQNGVTVKVNSYEHDEFGITTEDPLVTVKMQDKRLRKMAHIKKELKRYDTVKVYGDRKSSRALLCWGSNRGICVELAEKMKLRVIQPLLLMPFPEDEIRSALKGVRKLISVENNATGQLSRLAGCAGIKINKTIFKYDGRPFSLEELEKKVKTVLR